MGVSIHYSGRLKNAIELLPMITEVRDIAIEKGWDYFVFDEEFKNSKFTKKPKLDKLFGIMLTPNNCDPICFSFLSDGRMCGLINFKVIEINNKIDDFLAYNLFTKTQKAGYELHKQIVILIDYISNKYLSEFECLDDGQYWETRDENLLIETFNKFENFIDSFTSSLEMIPPNDGEEIEKYLHRIANSTFNRMNDSEDDLPQLSIEDENKFKRMKIELENEGFFGEIDAALPPEIESMFLDNIMQFENQFRDAKQITVFEKIGQPRFLKSEILSPKELEAELSRLFDLLEDNNILLNVIYEYENARLMIYDFITLELFNEKIDEISIPGMTINFIYEEFHPNHYEDLKRDGVAFWNDYFENRSEHFDEFTLSGLVNSDELFNFRELFEYFKKVQFTIVAVDFNVDEKIAKTKVHLKFDAMIDEKDKMTFDCVSVMTSIYENGYWYLNEVDLPS